MNVTVTSVQFTTDDKICVDGNWAIVVSTLHLFYRMLL